MAHIKRSYIDSHWLVFIFQGAVATLFGCITLFTSGANSSSLMPVIGVAVLALAIVEFANVIYRSSKRHEWVVPLLVALFDAIFGVILLLMANESTVWHMAILAGYTVARGIFEMIIGFRTTVDPTDRFIWVLCGVCGAVFGIAILNSGHLAWVDFVRFFGAYLLILGISSLIYGVHNREQQREDRLARSEAAKKAFRERTLRDNKAKRQAKNQAVTAESDLMPKAS